MSNKTSAPATPAPKQDAPNNASAAGASSDGVVDAQNSGAPSDPTPTPPAAVAQAAAIQVVMLRRDCIEGVWYPHGAVVTLPTALAKALEADGAIDTAEGAVAYAISKKAQQLVHETPAADEPSAEA